MDKNNIILGCGHTGTTLISGILHINGYATNCVDNLYENTELVRINEKILKKNIDENEIKSFFKKINKKNKYWTLKDPRLSDTIEYLEKFIKVPVRYIYNFREPGSTVNHLIKEYNSENMSYNDKLEASEKDWYDKNYKILNFISKLNNDEYLIINYDDLLELKLNVLLNRFFGKKLKFGYIKPKKRRSKTIEVDKKLSELYLEINKKYHESIIYWFLNSETISAIKTYDKIYSNFYDIFFKIKRKINNCYYINSKI